jgi:transposase
LSTHSGGTGAVGPGAGRCDETPDDVYGGTALRWCTVGVMERLVMRKVREVLRQSASGRSTRQIGAALGIASGSVVGYLQRARAADLTWEKASSMTDDAVEALLFRPVALGRNEPCARLPIPFAHVHQELRRDGVTLQLLWEEYRASTAGTAALAPYKYSQFCELYGAWRHRLSPTMRQVHRAGEKAFIDYSGKKPKLVDPETGEAHGVELFVMVLGASNYAFAEASLSQTVADFVASTTRGLEYFGCVPEILVPDQLRSAVRGPDRYDPVINEGYLDFATHYGVSVIPARPRKPRDKAKVEATVLLVQRWILARLRNLTFFRLSDLNDAIGALLDDLNQRPFQRLEGCRRSLFEALDRPAMRPLPAVRYELRERRKASVHIDYHVEFDGRLYSVHYTHIGKKVEVRATVGLVEIFLGDDRVASHPRSYARRGTPVTSNEHRPPQHQPGTWPPERLITWATTFGPSVAALVKKTLAKFRQPEHGYRACLGILRLAQKHGGERTDAACARALAACGAGVPHRTHVESILKHGLDRSPEAATTTTICPVEHENVRGGDYYERKEGLH